MPIDLPRPAASAFGPTDALDQNLPLLAIHGFGQNEVQMAQLHMAMIAGTVANGGQMMKPYVVEQTLDHDGRVLDRDRTGGVEDADLAGDRGRSMTRPHGQRRRERRRRVAASPSRGGVPVAAKTGWQLNNAPEPGARNAWIVAFAPADAPRYAVAVTILGTNEEISASTGGRLAGPVAKTVLDATLRGGG